MKPFITPEISAGGQKIFRFQCENIEPEDLSKYLVNSTVVGYSMPVEHSLRTAWIFRLILESGASLEFSSACTAVDGWKEVGSLNIELIDRTEEKPDVDAVLVRVNVPPFHVTSLAKLIYEEKEFCSECGIAVGGEDGEIVVATGTSPGSVSIAAPFSAIPIEPEFLLAECRREPL
jgi:hypothetical protein